MTDSYRKLDPGRRARFAPRRPSKPKRDAVADAARAYIKRARTRSLNEALRRIKEARRTHFPAAAYAMNETYEAMFLADVAGILEDVL